MQVQFTATFEELVDATVRVVRRVRRTNQRERVVGWAVMSLVAGLVGALIPVDREARQHPGRARPRVRDVRHAPAVHRNGESTPCPPNNPIDCRA